MVGKVFDMDKGIDEEYIWSAFVDLSNAVGYIQYVEVLVCQIGAKLSTEILRHEIYF